MPQLEIRKVNRLVKRLSGHQTLFLKRRDNIIALLHPGVNGLDQCIAASVKVVDKVRIVAFQADGLHPHFVILPAWTPLTDGREQEPRQPVAYIMSRACRAKSAHVAGGTRRSREICRIKCARFRVPVPIVAAGGIGDAVR